MNQEFADKNIEITKKINEKFQEAQGNIVHIEAQYLPDDWRRKSGSLSINAWYDNFPNTEHSFNRDSLLAIKEDRLITTDEVEEVFRRAKVILDIEEVRRSKR